MARCLPGGQLRPGPRRALYPTNQGKDRRRPCAPRGPPRARRRPTVMQDPGLPPEFSAYIPDVLETHALAVTTAVLALPLAAGLGAALAFRPRRRGTPARSA